MIRFQIAQSPESPKKDSPKKDSPPASPKKDSPPASPKKRSRSPSPEASKEKDKEESEHDSNSESDKEKDEPVCAVFGCCFAVFVLKIQVVVSRDLISRLCARFVAALISWLILCVFCVFVV